MDALTRDAFILRNMHFSDLDQLRPELRGSALAGIRARYGSVMSGPGVWAAMDADEWDAVPQPVRMAVFPMMIEHWIRAEEIGRGLGIDEQLVARTGEVPS